MRVFVVTARAVDHGMPFCLVTTDGFKAHATWQALINTPKVYKAVVFMGNVKIK